MLSRAREKGVLHRNYRVNHSNIRLPERACELVFHSIWASKSKNEGRIRWIMRAGHQMGLRILWFYPLDPMFLGFYLPKLLNSSDSTRKFRICVYCGCHWRQVPASQRHCGGHLYLQTCHVKYLCADNLFWTPWHYSGRWYLKCMKMPRGDWVAETAAEFLGQLTGQLNSGALCARRFHMSDRAYRAY